MALPTPAGSRRGATCSRGRWCVAVAVSWDQDAASLRVDRRGTGDVLNNATRDQPVKSCVGARGIRPRTGPLNPAPNPSVTGRGAAARVGGGIAAGVGKRRRIENSGIANTPDRAPTKLAPARWITSSTGTLRRRGGRPPPDKAVDRATGEADIASRVIGPARRRSMTYCRSLHEIDAHQERLRSR
jgi:hypothetical protein